MAFNSFEKAMNLDSSIREDVIKLQALVHKSSYSIGPNKVKLHLSQSKTEGKISVQPAEKSIISKNPDRREVLIEKFQVVSTLT